MRRTFYFASSIFLASIFLINTSFAQTITSIKDGPWNSASTWDGGVPTASNSTSIIVAHDVTVDADVTIDQTTIQSGGILSVDLLTTLTIADSDLDNDLVINSGGIFQLLDDGFSDGATVNVNGQLINSGSITLTRFLSFINFEAGSTYRHATSSGDVPYSSWNASSNCEITGVTSNEIRQFDQTFGNLIWNCPFQSGNKTLDFTGSSTSIAGNFEVISTSTAVLILSQGTGVNTTIAGNLVISGSSVMALTGVGNVTLNVGGNFDYNSSGIFRLAGTNGTGQLNLSGNLTHLSGELRGSATSSLNFSGSSQSFTGGGSFTTVNVTVESGSTLNLDASNPFTFNNLINNGTINASSGNNNIAGTFTNNGTFNNDGGTVTFTGTAGAISGTSSPSFYNFSNTGTFTAPTTLNVAGNFSNTGTFNHNDGTVEFNGSGTAQNITGTTTFYDINTSGTASVAIEGTAELTRFLQLGDGTSFDADGSGAGILRLLSTAENHAAGILAIPATATFSGNVTFQRYIAEGSEYTYMAFPINGLTISDLQANFPITGPFTGASTGTGLGSSSPSFYYYDEAVAGDYNLGWVNYPTSSSSAPVSSLTGYASYMRSSYSNPTTISLRGTINQGSQNLNVKYTSSTGVTDDGWNLVVNPYPCAIDWGASSGWTKTGLDGAAYIWDGVQHHAYLGAWDGIVAPGQAFWVKATSSPALSCTEEVKISEDSASFYRVGGVKNDCVIISLEDGKHTDKAFVYFKNDATDNFDHQYDAYKLSNAIFNLSSFVKENQFLAVNNVPFSGCTKNVGLKIDNIKKGNYNLKFTNLDYFNVDGQFTLIDHFLGTESEISESDAYAFSVTDDQNSYGSTRFELIFELAEAEKPAISFQDNTLTSSIGSGNQWYKNGEEIPDATGKTLELQETGIYHAVSSPYGCPASSDNMVAFVADSDQDIQECEKNISLQINSGNIGDFTLQLANLNVDEDTYVSKLVDKYLSTETEISEDLVYQFSINDEESSYMNRFEILFKNNLQPEISLEAHRLISNYEDGNQWFKDDTLIEGAVEDTYQATESGVYHVEVTNNGCAITSQKIAVNLQITGLEELKNKIKLYPNPGTNYLMIEIPELLKGQNFTLDFYDNVGKLSLRKELKSMNGKVSVDIRNLESGFYTISIRTDDTTVLNHKFLKN